MGELDERKNLAYEIVDKMVKRIVFSMIKNGGGGKNSFRNLYEFFWGVRRRMEVNVRWGVFRNCVDVDVFFKIYFLY